jgi:2-hydroxy-3-oxopropionate reductase
VRLEPGATLGFVGLGLMGKPMAQNLLKAGFKLRVWNRTPEKASELVAAGAELVSSLPEVTIGSGAIITMLQDGAAVTDVLFASGLASSSRPGTVFIDMSSIAPAIAEDHANLLETQGLKYIDAPVSGGTVGAANGSLAIMAGGLEADILQVQGVFDALGTLTHVGPHGRGQLCKLVNQSIVAITIGAVAEGLLLAKAGGADPAKVRTAIMGGFCQSRILELHGLRMIEQNFAPGGTVKNQIKDLNAVLEVAARLKLELPLTRRVHGLFSDLAAGGFEMLDHSALYLQLERENGL